jgi:hypothetical protein
MRKVERISTLANITKLSTLYSIKERAANILKVLYKSEKGGYTTTLEAHRDIRKLPHQNHYCYTRKQTVYITIYLERIEYTLELRTKELRELKSSRSLYTKRSYVRIIYLAS